MIGFARFTNASVIVIIFKHSSKKKGVVTDTNINWFGFIDSVFGDDEDGFRRYEAFAAFLF